MDYIICQPRLLIPIGLHFTLWISNQFHFLHDYLLSIFSLSPHFCKFPHANSVSDCSFCSLDRRTIRHRNCWTNSFHCVTQMWTRRCPFCRKFSCFCAQHPFAGCSISLALRELLPSRRHSPQQLCLEKRRFSCVCVWCSSECVCVWCSSKCEIHVNVSVHGWMILWCMNEDVMDEWTHMWMDGYMCCVDGYICVTWNFG